MPESKLGEKQILVFFHHHIFGCLGRRRREAHRPTSQYREERQKSALVIRISCLLNEKDLANFGETFFLVKTNIFTDIRRS